MKYLNRTFSVGGPLKGVSDAEYAAIFCPKCVHCGRHVDRNDLVVYPHPEGYQTPNPYHEVCWKIANNPKKVRNPK